VPLGIKEGKTSTNQQLKEEAMWSKARLGKIGVGKSWATVILTGDCCQLRIPAPTTRSVSYLFLLGVVNGPAK
jgi:hypothetical protein